jgi:hypothetical protein
MSSRTIVIQDNSPNVKHAGGGAYFATSEGTIRKEDGKYKSPISGMVSHGSMFFGGKYATEYVPFSPRLNCGSLVKGVAVADCVILSQEADNIPGTTLGVWSSRARVGVTKELIEGASKHMAACGYTMDNSGRWEERGGKMWGWATFNTRPDRPDPLRIFFARGGKLEEVDLMEFSRKAVSLGKSAVGIGKFIISAVRRLSQRQFELLDEGFILPDQIEEPYYVQMKMTSFIVGEWSDEGKPTFSKYDNPLVGVELPPGFGFKVDEDIGLGLGKNTTASVDDDEASSEDSEGTNEVRQPQTVIFTTQTPKPDERRLTPT